MIWKNNEGYYDPTAGAALSRIIKEERRRKREQQKAEEAQAEIGNKDNRRDSETKREVHK